MKTAAYQATQTASCSLPPRKIAWGRLAALATTIGLWAGIIAIVKLF